MNNEITLHYDELCTSHCLYKASMNGPAEYATCEYDFETFIEEDDVVDFAIFLTNEDRKESGDAKLTTEEQCAIDESIRALFDWELFNFEELRNNKKFVDFMKNKHEEEAQYRYEKEGD